MFTAKSDSMMKETLKNLCSTDGWCYGILWGFDQTNSLLLTLKDAYFGEEMGALMDNVLLQVHMLGEGIIGQVAFTKSNQWMFSDSHQGRQNSLGSFQSLQFLQDESEFYRQFCTGIKTIALISVEQWGVLQLGSTKKVPQENDFTEQVKELFSRIHISQNVIPSSSDQFLDSRTPLMSLLPSEIYGSANQNLQHTAAFEDFTLDDISSIFPFQSFPSSLDHHSTNSLFTPSFLTGDYIQIGDKPVDFEHSNVFDCSATFQPSGLLPLDELFSPLQGSSGTAFSNLPNNEQLSGNGLLPLTDLSGINFSENVPTNSVQSSVTCAFGSNREEKGSETCAIGNQFNGFGNGVKYEKESLMPVPIADLFNFGTNESECLTENYQRSKFRTSNSLFSQLGLDHILNGAASSSCSKAGFEDQATKRRKIDNYSFSHHKGKIEGVSNLDDEMKLPNPVMEVKTEASLKQTGLYAGDSTTKKKKARPGTKPRPKDRQMIQDRLAELRELIPNGEKMSIDRLLERTIKHLNFMQGIKRHAESLKNIDKQKCEAKGRNLSSNGVTWACEVGDQSMMCPLIVEDLNTPGQMLIEILCEEHGFFLEISNIIRDFGLVILKGVMEVREAKIWARYIVEAEGNRHVTRHEIFSTLIQLLQMTDQGSNDRFGDAMNTGVGSLFNNCQHDVLFPINLGDTLQC